MNYDLFCLFVALFAGRLGMDDFVVDHNRLNSFSCVKKSHYITFVSRLQQLHPVQLPQVTDLFKDVLLTKSGS